jgi:hypothetical protein
MSAQVLAEHAAMNAKVYSDEGSVGRPGVNMAVMLKFAFFSMAMVSTPTAVFFLSNARYLDCEPLLLPSHRT